MRSPARRGIVPGARLDALGLLARVIMSGPGAGMRTTSSARPRASRAASQARERSREIACCGSA